MLYGPLTPFDKKMVENKKKVLDKVATKCYLSKYGGTGNGKEI